MILYSGKIIVRSVQCYSSAIFLTVITSKHGGVFFVVFLSRKLPEVAQWEGKWPVSSLKLAGQVKVLNVTVGATRQFKLWVRKLKFHVWFLTQLAS